MSNPALTWARESRGLTPTQKLVLFVLADAANRDHVCWKAAALIAEETGLSDRGVRIALHDLIEAGAITGMMRSGVRPQWTLEVRETGTTFLPKRNGVPVSKRNHVPTNRKPVPLPNRNHVPSEPEPRSAKPEPRSKKPEPGSDEPLEPNEPTLNLKKEMAVVVTVAGFDDWWRVYPRKVGKDDARDAYRSAIKRGATEADLIDGLRRQRFGNEVKYIPHAATWLNGGRWQDEPEHVAPAASTTTDNIADLLNDPMGKGPKRRSANGFDFDGFAEEIPRDRK